MKIAGMTNGSPIASLAPRNTGTVTAEHNVTRADVDAGKIVHMAAAVRIDPACKSVRDDSNEVTIYINQQPQLIVAKFAEETSFSAVGDTIHYSVAVRNFENTTMTGILVSDPNAKITGINPIFRLESGKTAVVTAIH